MKPLSRVIEACRRLIRLPSGEPEHHRLFITAHKCLATRLKHLKACVNTKKL